MQSEKHGKYQHACVAFWMHRRITISGQYRQEMCTGECEEEEVGLNEEEEGYKAGTLP